MTVIVKRGDDEDGGIGGNSARGTVCYYTFDEDAIVTAHAAALAQCVIDFPNGLYRGMPLREANYSRIAPQTWKFPFTFGFELNQAQPSTIPHPEDPAHVDNVFRPVRGFNTIGGTRHITTSLETTQTVSIVGHTPEDFGRAINVEYSDDDSSAAVRGLDLLAGAADLTFTAQFPNAIITPAYFRTVCELSDPCHTNAATFHGFEVGELIFKGATGQARGSDYWEITFHFLFSKNATGVEVSPDLPTIDKTGWQYVWTMFKLQNPLVNGRKTKRPAQAFVETVYPAGDFAALLIGV